MKKGQIQQVFIYLLTIVAVGMVLLIGYRAIGGLMAKGCDVEKATFKSTLESYIDKYADFGSYHLENMKAPCSFAEVCFVSSDEIGTDPFTSTNPIIKDSVESGIEENIFLVKTEVTEPFGYMEEIEVEDGVVCIENSNGKFKIAFEGLGRKTNISIGAN